MTYGSLMFDPVWEKVVEGRYASLAARADGLRRQGVQGEHYPGVFRAADGQVDGRLYLDVSAEDLARIDAFEGDDYQRVSMSVVVRAVDAGSRAGPAVGEEVPAEVYLFLPVALLDGKEWDPVAFERTGVGAVIDDYISR